MSQHVFGISKMIHNYRFRKVAFLLLASGLFGVGGYKFNSQKEVVMTPTDNIKVMTFNEIQTKGQFSDVEKEISKGSTTVFYTDGIKPTNKFDS